MAGRIGGGSGKKKKKDNGASSAKAKKKKKAAKKAVAASVYGAATTAAGAIPVAVDSTSGFPAASGARKAWDAYGRALAGWAECAALLQLSATDLSLSWLEVWRRTMELDVMIMADLYWNGRWHDACAKSAMLQMAATAPTAESYVAAVGDIHAKYLDSCHRQWDRLLGL